MFVLGVIALLVLTLMLVLVHSTPKECPIMPPPSCPPVTTTCLSTPYFTPAAAAAAAAAAVIENPSRDRQVLNDPLYPPLNRTDEQTFNSVIREVKQGNIYIHPTAEYGDSYRLVGYLSSTDAYQRDAGNNNWKMYGRMKNHNQGDFYIMPASRDIDLKIPLTPEVVVGERLRDVYTLPEEMRFRSPMLNDSAYRFIEMPKADFSSTRYA